MELEEETNISLLMENVVVAGYTRKAKQCVLCWRSSTDPDPVKSECWLNWGYPQDMKIDHEKCIVAVSGKVDGFCNKAHMIFYGDVTVAELEVKLTEEPAKEEFEQFAMPLCQLSCASRLDLRGFPNSLRSSTKRWSCMTKSTLHAT